MIMNSNHIYDDVEASKTVKCLMIDDSGFWFLTVGLGSLVWIFFGKILHQKCEFPDLNKPTN